jgi:hypothetical protein
VLASQIVDCGTYWEYATRTPSKFVKSAVRLALPFYRPRDWRTSVLRLGWLFRDFQAVCVVLEKV